MKIIPFSSWREFWFLLSHPSLLIRPGLSREGMLDSPLQQFDIWYAQARKSLSLEFPNAMCLSTLRDDGYPDGRIVLLKERSPEGFVFYTNTLSSKGRALDKYPKACATFYWGPLQRQVRIRGTVRKVSDGQADAYFASRPRISQIGAWASNQSSIIASRDELESRASDFKKRYHDQNVPRPPHWTGYLIEAQEIEFWQLRIGRMHDRFLYSRDESAKWQVTRLAP